MDRVGSSVRIGVCLDTCHVFDAGYDVRDFGAVLDAFEREIGLARLKAIHINDSMNPLAAARIGMRGWGGSNRLGRVCGHRARRARGRVAADSRNAHAF